MLPMAQPRTVLVVDDERTIADVVARYLEREGYRAVVARDGEEALAVAERERPDIVVLDVMLPKLDGLQVMATAAPQAPDAGYPPDGARRGVRARQRAQARSL